VNAFSISLVPELGPALTVGEDEGCFLGLKDTVGDEVGRLLSPTLLVGDDDVEWLGCIDVVGAVVVVAAGAILVIRASFEFARGGYAFGTSLSPGLSPMLAVENAV